MDRQELIEALADKEHASWARWMDYVFEICPRSEDGSVTISRALVDRWQRQVDTPYAELTEREKDSDRKEVAEILPIIDASAADVRQSKDQAYQERDMLIACLASLCKEQGYVVGLGRHPESEEWEDDWRTIVYIDLPAGQVSWHIHDSERPLFWFLGKYLGKWDGHSTTEKYKRLLRQFTDDTSFARTLKLERQAQ